MYDFQTVLNPVCYVNENSNINWPNKKQSLHSTKLEPVV